LELLLVTPISPAQIIFGRVWGLWKQFLPATLALLAIWWYAENLVTAYGIGWPSRSTATIWNLIYSPLQEVAWGNNSDGYNLQFIRWSLPGRLPSEHTISNLQMIVALSAFLSLPVFATYFALRVKNLIVAAALAWLALFLCPFFAFCAFGCFSGLLGFIPAALIYIGVFMTNAAFALLACFLLRHSLSRRIYSF
jgi:hypothetical protein